MCPFWNFWVIVPDILELLVKFFSLLIYILLHFGYLGTECTVFLSQLLQGSLHLRGGSLMFRHQLFEVLFQLE